MSIKELAIKMLGELHLSAQKAGDIVYASKIKKELLACGSNVSIGKNCMMIPEHVSIGNNVSIGYSCSLMASIAYIYIGNNVMLAPGVVIRGGVHRYDLVGKTMMEVTENEKLPENDQDVIIEDDVWIGQNAIILKGVRVGEGSIIGAGSVVTKDVPPYTIHVGAHGIMEKPRFSQEELTKHIEVLNLRRNEHE